MNLETSSHDPFIGAGAKVRCQFSYLLEALAARAGGKQGGVR